jgi:hypothetical protein
MSRVAFPYPFNDRATSAPVLPRMGLSPRGVTGVVATATEAVARGERRPAYRTTARRLRHAAPHPREARESRGMTRVARESCSASACSFDFGAWRDYVEPKMIAHSSSVFLNEQMHWTLRATCSACERETVGALNMGVPVNCGGCGLVIQIDPSRTVFHRGESSGYAHGPLLDQAWLTPRDSGRPTRGAGGCSR